MYNNSSQYSGQNYQGYEQYPQNYNTGYSTYQSYDQHYMNTGTQPGPPGESYPQSNWAPVGYTTGAAAPVDSREEAVAQEKKQQKAQLVKQREDYVKKAAVLRRELDQLRNQKQDLLADGSDDRDLEIILRENDKLQEEIQGKMKAIHNVIEMLSSIIKDGRRITDLEASIEQEESSGQRTSKATQRTGEEGSTVVGSRYCIVHYDTGLHWCRLCDEFPETAKEFLLHLQSKKHLENAKENDVGDNTPWHKLPAEPTLPSHEDGQKKRIPIKGLQFFISAPSWYCKLCDIWIGDLHCASHHLKSQAHYQNYDIFVQSNPHWEMEWLKDREKAMTRNGKHSSDSDSNSNKRRKKRSKDKRNLDSIMKDKKRKKRSKKRKKHETDSSSSSSSSDSSSEAEQNDKSKSIRVAMRNMKVQSIMNEDLQGKWSVLERIVEEHKKKEKEEQVKERPKAEPEDKLISQWMTVSEQPEPEKNLLSSLKDRMKQKQDIELAKYAEIERKKQEMEQQEKELQAKKEREAQEAAEEAERERKRREQEEYERIRDKERDQVRFKPKESHQRRRSHSRSPHHDSRSSPRSKSYRTDSPTNRYGRGGRDHDRGRDRNRDRDRDHHDRSRSRSLDRKSEDKKKSNYKKLPFIGRMPLFKNKKPEGKVEGKEIKKEDYEPQRRTRFQPGNLAKAFIPSPDVVCFPKLSSYPPLAPPPPPTVSIEPEPPTPDPPKISKEQSTSPKPPPPPQIAESASEQSKEPVPDPTTEMDPAMMEQYYAEYNNMMYSQMYDYGQNADTSSDVPHSHTMPLMPPPLPPSEPEDDLAMLGICADDMAAQSF